MTPVDIHPSQRQLHITPITTPLYVVCAIENPEQFASRYRHYPAFAKHIEDSGAILYTVEVVSGNRNFEVTSATNPRHVQLRCKTDLWRKECLQNIGVGRLPHNWERVALCDADFLNTRADWVQATLQALERYDAVQMFSTYSFLKADNTVESTNKGFIYASMQVEQAPSTEYGPRGATGGEWAYTRKCWDAIRGMLQTPILGSADWYMTYALSGMSDKLKDEELSRCAPAYIKSVTDWTERAKVINGNIGYVENHAVHYWHGAVNTRGYGWRWKILATYAFDPTADLITEHSGLLELAGNKPGMQKEIRAYIRSRNEDAQG